MAKVKPAPARKPKLGRVARDIKAGLEEIRRFLAGAKHGLTVYHPPPEAQAIGELVTAREKAGLSVEQVAEAVGVTVDKIEKLEAGEVRKPTVDVLAKYASAVGMALRLTVVRKEKVAIKGK